MEAQYASRWRRFFAALLDGIILLVFQSIIGMMLGFGALSLTGNEFTSAATTAVWMSYVVNLTISVAYWVFLQASMGQTLGKKALGIKVVDSEGKTPSVVTFFLREIVGKIVSAIILLIGYLMILWDDKRQGLHDKIAGTYVIKV